MGGCLNCKGNKFIWRFSKDAFMCCYCGKIETIEEQKAEFKRNVRGLKN